MYSTIPLVGSWDWVGIKLIGQVENSPLQYVPGQPCCRVIRRLSYWFLPAVKDDLDREPLLRGRFVLLSRVDGHAYWASNAILSNLQNLPEEVDGGLIVRDGGGKPTGPSNPFLMIWHLRCISAQPFL